MMPGNVLQAVSRQVFHARVPDIAEAQDADHALAVIDHSRHFVRKTDTARAQP